MGTSGPRNLGGLQLRRGDWGDARRLAMLAEPCNVTAVESDGGSPNLIQKPEDRAGCDGTGRGLAVCTALASLRSPFECRSGETGRRAGLKIPFGSPRVWVRPPPPAPRSQRVARSASRSLQPSSRWIVLELC